MSSVNSTTTGSPHESMTSRTLKLTLYSFIFGVSLIGNTLVCLVVCRQRRLRTSTNYYIVNLACADLAITTLCIPFDIVIQENSYVWPFGHFLCRIIYPLMTMSAFASVGTLTAIALNRYFAVSQPMRARASKKRAKVAIGVIWLVSVSAVLPYVLVLEVNKDSLCVETWSKFWSKCYTVFIFVFQYLIPLSVITVAYIIIGIQLQKNRAHLAAAHRRQDRDVAKVVRMMVIVVIIFAVSMLPNHIFWMLREFNDKFPKDWGSFSHWGELLIYANSCSNPIVYSICIEEFRMAFKAYITKCCRVTDEDVRPVNRMFERISFRGKSFSSDRLLGRQAVRHGNRRLDSRNYRRGKIFQATHSQTIFRESELPNHSELRMNSIGTLDVVKYNGEQMTNTKENRYEKKNALEKLKNDSSHKVTRV